MKAFPSLISFLCVVLMLSTNGSNTATAFAPALAGTRGKRSAVSMADVPSNLPNPSDLQQKLKDLTDRIDVSAITSSVKDNVMEGEVGQRGEAYTAAQAGLLLCILLGGVPILGEPLMELVGPGLTLAGLVGILISVNDLGDALSPWPVVPSKATLKTGGVYSEVRHPMYASLLCAAAGLSLLTDSADRLLLTALLWYALDLKSNYEEAELLDAFPEYADYMEEVPSKFIPVSIVNELPWNKE